jgi:shikimate kinase/3-dehydroquinate synthase
MFRDADPREVLERLAAARHPIYAEADLSVLCSDEPPELTTRRVARRSSPTARPGRVRVELAQAGYDILIGDGLLRRAGAEMARRLEGRRAVVVSDRNVAPLHLPALREGLEEAGFTVAAEIAVPPGEGSKSLAEFGRVVEGILDVRPDRRMAVVALGGGVVGDLAGYAAASVLRGLPFVQCPTSLLAQVDSSVGGKTGINSRHGKNLLGAFTSRSWCWPIPRRCAPCPRASCARAGARLPSTACWKARSGIGARPMAHAPWPGIRRRWSTPSAKAAG